VREITAQTDFPEGSSRGSDLLLTEFLELPNDARYRCGISSPTVTSPDLSRWSEGYLRALRREAGYLHALTGIALGVVAMIFWKPLGDLGPRAEGPLEGLANHVAWMFTAANLVAVISSCLVWEWLP